MKGGRADPDADTHDYIVCVFPFSPEVTDQTFLRPTSVITFPGLCTTVTPVSSIFHICIGFASKFSFVHTAASFPK